MTRREFNLIAMSLKATRPKGFRKRSRVDEFKSWEHVVEGLISTFKQINSSFNAEFFSIACGLVEVED